MNLAQEILKVAELRGEFLLRSGQTSNVYFDKYQFEARPNILSAIAEELSAKIPKDTEILAGLEMGGIPIATALSLKTGIPCVFVRKEAKKYGTCKFAEGPDVQNKKVLVVEDVITSGGQLIASTKDLRSVGAQIDAALCVILREDKAIEKLQEHAISLLPLFRKEDLYSA